MARARPSRRAVLLAGAGAVAGGVASVSLIRAPASGAVAPRQRLADPFTLGVASGDPAPDGMVLWTRLAPTPLAEDGLGGMPPPPIEVEWELAADERFTRIERRGTEVAVPDAAHSVHVELAGLRPGREYFYRFRAGGHVSPAGRTRTAPNPGVLGGPLTMCFASCSQYEHGYFTAYRRLAEEDPDLMLHLGDYQYEHRADDYVAPGGNVRDHLGPETVTLANYRQRHAQYKTDPDLQAAHAVAPWLVVWDDHELDNNWADEIPEEPQPDYLARRAAAFRAYYENMPLRRASVPRGIDLQLYRRVEWGRLATFHMLDTRQYRDDQPCGDEFGSDCAQRSDPARSITGDGQEAWLLDGLTGSDARWDVLGQQVFFSQVDFAPGEARGFNPDAWDGYAANRDRVAAGLAQARNAVVLTGDVHAHWAAEVKERCDDPTSATVATELVATSITSGGDGSETRSDTAGILADNPHIRFYNNRRGYVRTRFTGSELRADFRVVPFVSRPDAPVETRRSFAIGDRESGLDPA